MRDDITVNVSVPQYRVHLVGRWSSFTGIAATPCMLKRAETMRKVIFRTFGFSFNWPLISQIIPANVGYPKGV